MRNHIHNTKFHTISIKRYYVAPIIPEEMTLRQLLSAYFQISSMKYRNEEEIWKATEDMYDYSYTVKSDVHGSYAVFYQQGNAIHPKFVNDPEYTLEKIFGLFEDLSTPLIMDDTFDERTFKKAKRLLKSTLEKNQKYHEYNATKEAIQAYFKGTNREYNVQGNLNELKKITRDDLYTYYLKFKEEEHDTFTIGDFEDGYTIKSSHPLELHNEMNFRARLENPNTHFASANTKQTYLRLIYDTKVFMGDMDIYPMSILNYALGGSTYSHLFRIVREKYGICYSIDSELYGASGIVLISAEIKREDIDKAILAIEEAIHTVLDTIDMVKIKRLLIISNESKYDSQGAFLTECLRKTCFPQAYDDPYYKERIEHVSLEDIQRVHKKLLITPFIFTYGGGKHE